MKDKAFLIIAACFLSSALPFFSQIQGAVGEMETRRNGLIPGIKLTLAVQL